MFQQLVFLVLLNLSGVYCQQCACVTSTKNVRSGAGTWYSIRGKVSPPTCLPYLGKTKVAGGFTWRNVNFNNQASWMGGRYITIKPCPSAAVSASTRSGCPRIISRAEWGAMSPKSTPRSISAPKNVFIHHGASGSCTTEQACAAKVRGYQRYHMNTRGWNDIGYSFLVGEDGNVYEGRGWKVAGAHTSGYNTKGYGISVIGNFENRVPNSAAQTALKRLIACGVSKGYIRSNYRLVGHRDVGKTKCPGKRLYDLIKTWPHYSSTPY